MDHDHPLAFGTFLTPLNADPLGPVRLAQLSQEVGLEYVGIQDHPYQPRFHEAWTLLSWIAGQAERIRLMPAVLNTPMRHPGVMARSAASLDLLSGGRVELGLGAGGFWDAMEAMGIPRLTPGESVDALAQAIEIMRSMWDTSRPGSGPQPGPAPESRIPLHIGGSGPRMLRLIGRVGDGWVIPGGTSGLAQVPERSRIIDDAASAAGRDPAEIRRFANIPERDPAQWQEWAHELTAMALELGISGFLLASDDAETIEVYGRQVVPLVRENVAAARAGAGVRAALVAPLYVRQHRREHIDYESIPASLVDRAVEPGDVAYGAKQNNYIRGGSPGLVLRPSSAHEVAEALAWARSQGAPDQVPLGVRSGGHGFSGRSTNDGGIVIDLGALNSIEVLDVPGRLVRIEPGARWGEVAAALRPHGWALSSGDSGGVGVGGLATAGGIGFLARAHGLTIDHVRAVELVLADGTPTRASADENPALFWAMRGAGFAFGIVTAFEFQVDEVGLVGFATLAHDVTGDPEGFLVRWGEAVATSARDTTSFLIMGPPREGRMIAQTMNVIDSEDPETIIERLGPITQAAPLVGQRVTLAPYDAIVTASPRTVYERTGHQGVGEPASRSGLLERVTPEFAHDSIALLRSGASYFYQIRALGGATSEVDPGATAFAHRSANFAVLAMAPSPARIDPQWERMRGHFRGIYLSFETDQHPDRLMDAFPPATLARLRELKRRYDPQNVFRDNFNLLPAD